MFRLHVQYRQYYYCSQVYLNQGSQPAARGCVLCGPLTFLKTVPFCMMKNSYLISENMSVTI
jgi:hypothetical protein